MDEGLVFVGKIVDTQPIAGADFIVAVTVVCGSGGKWRGVVRKSDFANSSRCLVYLPDSLIPETPEMQFMDSQGWRVKMRKFKGTASEVLIMPILGNDEIGMDLTIQLGVTKYHKPVPAHLQGSALGSFPQFIPKTDELNYQRHPELVEQLIGQPYYITEKADGSSTTAYRYKGHFGVCSRNLELVHNENNGYWRMALKYNLENLLPEGRALQWETCGPGIQSNPMGLKEISAFAFSAYNIEEQRYMNMYEFIELTKFLNFPICKILSMNQSFSKDGLELLGEGTYANGKQREGIVVRSQDNCENGKPISFKVINLNYEQ